MPILGTIEWNTDTGTFLKDSDISSVVTSMDEKGLNEIEGSFATPMTNEMKTGLSLEALNIDGRAPLNELSLELSKKIQNSITDMEAIKKTAQGEGNKHRQGEANEYYERVIDEYRKRWEPVKDAQQAYRDSRTYKVEHERTVDDGKGGTKKETYTETKTYPDCAIQYSIDSEVSVTSIAESDPEDVDPGVAAHDALVQAVKDEVEKANEFYNEYVVKAKKLKEECAGLDTSVGTPSSASASGDQPYGVQEGAEQTSHHEYSDGSTRDVYTNPDGSTVTVDKDADGNMKFQRLEDENGNVTETRWYDKDGNVKEKYEFKIEEEQEGVYKSTPTHYVQDENGELVKDEDYDVEKGTMYYWYDKDGHHHGGTEAPDASEVGPTPEKTTPTEETTEETEKSDKTNDSKTGAGKETTTDDSKAQEEKDTSSTAKSNTEMSQQIETAGKSRDKWKEQESITTANDNFDYYELDGVSIATYGDQPMYYSVTDENGKVHWFNNAYEETTYEEIEAIRKEVNG